MFRERRFLHRCNPVSFFLVCVVLLEGPMSRLSLLPYMSRFVENSTVKSEHELFFFLSFFPFAVCVCVCVCIFLFNHQMFELADIVFPASIGKPRPSNNNNNVLWECCRAAKYCGSPAVLSLFFEGVPPHQGVQHPSKRVSSNRFPMSATTTRATQHPSRDSTLTQARLRATVSMRLAASSAVQSSMARTTQRWRESSARVRFAAL